MTTLKATDLEGDAIEYYIPTTPDYSFDGLGSDVFHVETVQNGDDYYAYLYFLDDFEVDREVCNKLENLHVHVHVLSITGHFSVSPKKETAGNQDYNCNITAKVNLSLLLSPLPFFCRNNIV